MLSGPYWRRPTLVAENSETTVVVAGSVAIDTVGRTSQSLNEGPLLNLKLTSLRERFGGCAANVSYNLAHLGAAPLLCAPIGEGASVAHLGHLERVSVDLSALLYLPDTGGAQAFIFTDPNGVQLTAFYPGPLPATEQWRRHLADLPWERVDSFVQTPESVPLMLAGLEAARNAGLRQILWCPGQYAEQLSPEDVVSALENCDCIIGNKRELQFFWNVLGGFADKHVILTAGPDPVKVYRSGQELLQCEVPETPSVDPTGCGDAFLAGFLARWRESAFSDDTDHLATAVNAGVQLAQVCLQRNGGQGHRD